MGRRRHPGVDIEMQAVSPLKDPESRIIEGFTVRDGLDDVRCA
ncbi:hypothetical protein [Marinobacterium sedimentorum]|nr:hypothetical protein [Marinobacterium sedimentorum]